MLKPSKLNRRRRAHNQKAYLIGSVQFIEDVYEKLIKEAELRNDEEIARIFKDCKIQALKRRNNIYQRSIKELEQMQ